jgi:hypothetical protein
VKFKLQHKNGGELTRRASDFFEFESDLNSVPVNEVADYAFFIDGKPVSFEVAMQATQDCIDAFRTQRAATQKQVWARKQGTQGNFKNNYHQIWVKK